MSFLFLRSQGRFCELKCAHPIMILVLFFLETILKLEGKLGLRFVAIHKGTRLKDARDSLLKDACDSLLKDAFDSCVGFKL